MPKREEFSDDYDSDPAVLPQFIRVKMDKLPIFCPLCNKILKRPTMITECMDRFCEKCIYEKVHAGGLSACPNCDKDLSHLSPYQYLRYCSSFERIITILVGDSMGADHRETPQGSSGSSGITELRETPQAPPAPPIVDDSEVNKPEKKEAS